MSDKYLERLASYGESVNDLKSMATKLDAMGMRQDARRLRLARREIKVMFRTYQQLWMRAEKALAKAADHIEKLEAKPDDE